MGNSRVVLDAKEWRSFFGKILRDLRDPIPKLRTAAMTFGFTNIIEHFKNEEGPEGKWPAWSESYKKWRYKSVSAKKIAAGRTPRMLQLSGILRNSLLQGKTGSGIKKVGRTGVLMFTKVPYSGKHNYGEGKIPKREFMWLSGETKQKMVDYLLDSLLKYN